MNNSTVPESIGVILDGNRRWAREHNLPSLEGHRAGFNKVRALMDWAHELGIRTVYIYAFSTENWNRAPEEVNYLMELFAEAFSGTFVQETLDRNGRIVFLGDRSRIPAALRTKMEETEALTKGGTEGTLAVCLSYGGRAEIVAATNALIRAGAEISGEEDFARALWSAELPDPDLIIRTGGDQRLSNFLLWQMAYSELFFTSTKWPVFSKEELVQIVEEYASRERRRGK